MFHNDFQPRRVGSAALAALAALAPVACGGDGGSEEAGGDARLARGREVYLARCAECHGADLRGTPRGPSQLSVVYEPSHHDDAAYRAAIADGVRAHHWNFGDMPPIPGLPDGDVGAVIAYIRAEQEARGFEPYPPP